MTFVITLFNKWWDELTEMEQSSPHHLVTTHQPVYLSDGQQVADIHRQDEPREGPMTLKGVSIFQIDFQ